MTSSSTDNPSRERRQAIHNRAASGSERPLWSGQTTAMGSWRQCSAVNTAGGPAVHSARTMPLRPARHRWTPPATYLTSPSTRIANPPAKQNRAIEELALFGDVAAVVPHKRWSWAGPLRSGINTSHHPRIRNRLADVFQAADPGYGALDAQAEAAVGDGAVAAEVEVPLVVRLRQPSSFIRSSRVSRSSSRCEPPMISP